jgi:sugar lactone lactonase YvrE
VLTALLPGQVAAADRPTWDTRVFASVPSPGFPAYVYAHPNGRVYGGTYTNPLGDSYRSRVFEWTTGGTLLRSWTVPGQDLTAERGVQVATSDARGRLVLLEKSTRAVLTLDIRTGRFKRQATLPEGSIPNYATWGPGGALFVSDYAKPVIWRIPARGGTPRAWFTSPALSGVEFGTTGLVYQPGRRAFLIAQQTTTNPLDLARGKLYRLPVGDDGRPGSLRTLWTSLPLELPDGFGVARSGRIYVALLGTNQIVVLSSSGAQLERFPSTPLLGSNGSPVPFDAPSNATFLGTRLLVANQSALFGDHTHQVILDVEVGEPGAARYLPARSTLS